MSQENVDRMRRTNDAFNRRDLEAWLLNADPDVRISSSCIGQEFQGLDGAREWWREVTEAMPDFKVELEEI